MSKNSNILSAIDNHITLIIAVVIAICMTFCSTGCSGGDYERIPGPAIPAITDAGPDGTPVVLTPPGTTPDPNSGACKAVPAWWDLRSYQGCMPAGSSRLAGAIRFANRKEQPFNGKPFLDTEGDRKGEQGSLFSLTNPSSEDCGPVKVAVISNSGTVTLTIASEVEFYTLRSASVEAVWMKLHNGAAPSIEEAYGEEMRSLLLDLFECEREGSCSPTLTSKVPAGLLTGIVQDNGTSNSAVTNGAFCGRTFFLMRSK
jgi:hypothetical protein